MRLPPCRNLVACAIGLLLTAPLGARETYPFSYPPLAALTAKNVTELNKIGKRDPWPLLLPMSIANGWQDVPFLGKLPPVEFLAFLEEAGASDLRFLLLPATQPAAPPRALLTFRAALAGETDLQQILKRLGVDAENVALHIVDDTVRLGDSKATLEGFDTAEPLSPSEMAFPWRKSLDKMYACRQDGLTAWVNLEWLNSLLAIHEKTRLDLRGELRRTDLPFPQTAVLHAGATERATRLSLALHFDPDRFGFPPVSSADTEKPATPLSAGFTEGAAFSVSLDLEGLKLAPPAELEAAGTGKTPLPTLWTTALRLTATGGTELAHDLAIQEEMLKLLTGVGVERDLLAYLGDRLALSVYPQRDGPGIRLGAVARVTRPEALKRELRRSLAWAAFFAKTRDAPLVFKQVEVMGLEAAWSLEREGENRGRHWLLLTNRHLAYIQVDPQFHVQLNTDVRFLQTLFSPGGAGDGGGSGTLCRWTYRPGADLDRELGRSLPMASFLLGYLAPEFGEIVAADHTLTITINGESAPLATAMALAAGSQKVKKFLARQRDSSNAVFAVEWLRRILWAQQIYRNQGFGRLNGRDAAFAPTLPALLQDRGEDDEPLAGYYTDLFDPPEEQRLGQFVPFIAFVEHVAGGGQAFGYRFLQPRFRGETAIDPAHTWALLAVPIHPRVGPVLLILHDGELWQRPLPPEKTTLASWERLPANLEAAGWRRR